jgi:carbonic anhydrase/acetyltransferase-like protein (isoleucine patch superfamily)
LSSNTTFRTSTIGRSSHIASHTTIIDSYLFDNVSIGKGCVLKGCIVAQDVVIGANVRIGVGALVGAGVRVGDGEVIEDFARVARTPFGKEEGEEDDDDEYAPGSSGRFKRDEMHG